jgi:FkbM family methyltransferase
MNLLLDRTQLTQNIIMQLFDKGEEYEPEVCQLLRSLLRTGDNFVDVGAHVGYFTILASELVGSGKVVAFEPEESNYDSLMVNIEENGYQNTTAFQACVGDRDGEVDLILNLDNDGGHSIFDPRTHPFNTRTKKSEQIKQTVPIVKLDTVIGFVPKAIKIDVEGCEMMVLQGAKEILMKHSPVIIMEINTYSLGEAGTSPGEMQDFLESFGYIGFTLSNGERVELRGLKHKALVFNVAFVRLPNTDHNKQN